MHCTEKVILFVIKHIILHGHTRGDEFCNTSLHQFLGEFRVFQLVTDSHSLTCPNQFGQIGIQSVMGKSCHLVAFHTCPIVSASQRDTENLRSRYSIFTIGLIEITTTKQQQGLWVFRLEVEELLHHGSELLAVVFCHYLKNLNAKIRIFLENFAFQPIFRIFAFYKNENNKNISIWNTILETLNRSGRSDG